MLTSVLIANRGEIARRVATTCRRLGIRTITVHSEADEGALHVREADESVLLGPAPPSQSYLDTDKVLKAALSCGVEAVHPGYGFLSEDAEFAKAVIDAGLIWVGPAPEIIRQMGDKVEARNSMQSVGVPVAPGSTEPLVDVDAALATADRLGFPLMVKAAAGGGGIGMGIAHDREELRQTFGSAQSRGSRFFGSSAILLERYVENAKHIEVQILGKTDGGVIALGERDCSVQRRHQKVIEETPSPNLDPTLRERMLQAAVTAAESVSYRGAGTIEFLVDVNAGDFFFLEMNTRLQVEHPVTELVYDLDLVEQQIRIASGQDIAFDPSAGPQGHVIEMRVYAEDSVRFLPGPGRITRWEQPTGAGIRIDSGYRSGDVVSPHYDPLLAKLCVYGATRADTLRRAREALDGFKVEGIKVNLDFLREVLECPNFVSGEYDTGLVASLR